MYDASGLFFLYGETPIHWGTGASLSAVDLPVQRERHTDYPMAQAAGLKGSLRDVFERRADPLVEAIFGPKEKAGERSGCLAVTDARVLLFPVRSLRGTFAYATSLLALERLRRDVMRTTAAPVFDLPEDPGAPRVLVTSDSMLRAGEKGAPRVVFDEFSYEASVSEELDGLAAWIADHAIPQGEAGEFARSVLPGRLALLPEDQFRDFVLNATMVETHVSIDDETGTARERLLFTQETLPPDCLFWSLVLARAPFTRRRNGRHVDAPDKEKSLRDGTAVLEHIRRHFAEHPWLQTGGDATTGRGQVAVNLLVASNRKEAV